VGLTGCGGDTTASARIFGGGEGGPMAAFAPLISNHLGAKKVTIKYAINGKVRSVELPGIMQLALQPLGSLHPSGEIWVRSVIRSHPTGRPAPWSARGSTFADHGMRWDNSGKNGLYALIDWSN
jgi:hypothetical protein